MKRSNLSSKNEGGNMWRSATTDKPIAGYDKVVMQDRKNSNSIRKPPQPQTTGSSTSSAFIPGLQAIPPTNKIQNNLSKALQE